MNFGNMGFFEIMLILVVVLLLFGAKRLPEIGASFGKSISSFKKGLADTSASIREEAQPSLPPQQAESIKQDEAVRPEPKRLIP
ncbi:MAG: Sec-independent protein translocase subunit TatA/TatB [Gemmatimonadota bacterium]